MPGLSRLVRRLTLGCVLATLGCIPSRSDLEVMQSVNDLGDVVNALKQDYGAMADQVDSLRLVVTKQDSLLRVLANLAGVAVPSTP